MVIPVWAHFGDPPPSLHLQACGLHTALTYLPLPSDHEIEDGATLSVRVHSPVDKWTSEQLAARVAEVTTAGDVFDTYDRTGDVSDDGFAVVVAARNATTEQVRAVRKVIDPCKSHLSTSLH